MSELMAVYCRWTHHTELARTQVEQKSRHICLPWPGF